jgi:hypothetical protein
MTTPTTVIKIGITTTTTIIMIANNNSDNNAFQTVCGRVRVLEGGRAGVESG